MRSARETEAARRLAKGALYVKKNRTTNGEGGCNDPKNTHKLRSMAAGRVAQTGGELRQCREDLFEA